MKSSPHVRGFFRDGLDQARAAADSLATPRTLDLAPSAADAPATRDAAPTLDTAIGRTRDWLLGQQHAAGYWVGELEGDTILESEYILLLAYLGEHRSPRALKAARYLLEKQLPAGGWAIYPGGALEISASVKAYFALKLTGHNPEAPHMQRARAAIRAAGGADAVNSFTRFYLALLGQISYAQCPAVPPEMTLLPAWFPINLYRMSAWSRTILVPLSIMWAFRPATAIEPELGIGELFLRPADEWPPLRCPSAAPARWPISWERFFRGVDASLKWLDRRGCTPLRQRGIAAAKNWMIDRFAGSEGLGAIFPPMVWSIIALRCLGYADDSPEMKYCHQSLDGLILEDESTLRLQPCKSPVWDTAIAVRALVAAGVDREAPSLENATSWLLSQEIRRRGDWSAVVDVEPGGWCFEHANEFYPDVDDTTMVLMALWPPSPGTCRQPAADTTAVTREAWGCDVINQPGMAEIASASSTNTRAILQQFAPPQLAPAAVIAPPVLAAATRARQWVLALQNGDGGWAAFDRGNDRQFLCHVPFADHNAMIDPSTPDLTARALEALAQMGARLGEPAVDRAIEYLRRSQESNGSWFGRWGVNYIYGTWQALVGLAEIGLAPDDPMIAAGAAWLFHCQQPCGGWGESADSYAEPHLRGQGPVTASQTAWALLGLIAAGHHAHPAVRRGIQYLLETQQPDGTWQETEFTGTGFPRVFYLRYHLYPIYFPLLALARWAACKHKQKNTTESRRHGEEM